MAPGADSVGDTSNWQFAAVVAAVVMGLGGLLLFTLVAIIGSWRVFRLASQSLRAAERASLAAEELARRLGDQLAAAAGPGDLSELRRQADALLEQQARLQDATRRLVEARAIVGEDARRQLQELEASVQRLEDHMGRVSAVIANLGPRAT
jgi:hypothetical protein